MDDIGKMVILEKERVIFGYVLGYEINFEKHTLSGLIVTNEENCYIVDIDKVKTSDVVVISSYSDLEIVNEEQVFRKTVITESGENLGFAEKYLFNGRKLTKIITNLCEIPAKFVSFAGMDVIFVSFKRKRRFPRENDESIKVSIMETAPTRAGLSSSNFIGKTATKTLLGQNSELIVRIGDKITKQVVERAKLHNMLNELFYISKN